MALPVETNVALVQAETHDQQYFLDLFDRILPADFLATLKSPGPGYEIWEAFAALGERFSQAAARFYVGNFIRTAAGGQAAQANVMFIRTTSTAGAVIVKAGTVVTTSVGDRRFILQSDVAFGASDLGPIQGLTQADNVGYQYNVRGQRTAADGAVLPGEIDTIYSLIEEPAYGDPTITVYQVEDASGGQAAMLDELGFDRGIGRAAGESDESYRARIESLPDTVSPAAIRRALDALLDPFGITYQLIESWQVGYAWDRTLAYDDPRTDVPYRGCWVDANTFRAAFIVLVQSVGAIKDYGWSYDDPGLIPADFQTPGITGGLRAVNAYDVPGSTISSELQGAYDGYDTGSATLFLSVWNFLQAIKAAGVNVIIDKAPAAVPVAPVVVAVGDHISAVSSDGEVWSSGGIVPIVCEAVAYNGSRLVAVGDGVAISDDGGLTWVACLTPPAGFYYGVRWIDALSKYIAVGENGACATSPDGLVWTPQTMPDTNSYQDVAWNGTRLVAVSSGGTAALSDDGGTTWVGHNIDVGESYYSIVAVGSTFITIGSACATSTGGVVWTNRTVPGTGGYDVLASNGTDIVATGYSYIIPDPDPGPPYTLVANSIVSSDAGATWSILHSMPAGEFYGLDWNNADAEWIAIGISSYWIPPQSGACATSLDGSAWTARTLPAGLYFSVLVMS